MRAHPWDEIEVNNVIVLKEQWGSSPHKHNLEAARRENGLCEGGRDVRLSWVRGFFGRCPQGPGVWNRPVYALGRARGERYKHREAPASGDRFLSERVTTFPRTMNQQFQTLSERSIKQHWPVWCGEWDGDRGGGAGEQDPDRAEEFWLKHCCWLSLMLRLKTKYGVVRQSWIYGGGKAHCTLCARPLPHKRWSAFVFSSLTARTAWAFGVQWGIFADNHEWVVFTFELKILQSANS